MGQRYDTVDVGVIGQCFGMDVTAKLVGNGPRNGRRTVDRGENADVIASGNPAIGAHDALEKRLGLRCFMGVDTECVVSGEVAHFNVLHVHMLARLDGP